MREPTLTHGGKRLLLLLLSGGGNVPHPLLNRSGNPEARVGTERLDERGRLRVGLELKRLLRAFRHPERAYGPCSRGR